MVPHCRGSRLVCRQRVTQAVCLSVKRKKTCRRTDLVSQRRRQSVSVFSSHPFTASGACYLLLASAVRGNDCSFCHTASPRHQLSRHRVSIPLAIELHQKTRSLKVASLSHPARVLVYIHIPYISYPKQGPAAFSRAFYLHGAMKEKH